MGGVVFRVFGTDALCFLPSTIAIKVTAIPEMAHIPGAPIELRGVALVDGAMIPIIEVVADGAEPSITRERASSDGRAMLVCTVLGESVGLVGIDVHATGFFDSDDAAEGADGDGDGAGAPTTKHVRVPSMHGEGFMRAGLFDVAGVIARVREGRWAV